MGEFGFRFVTAVRRLKGVTTPLQTRNYLLPLPCNKATNPIEDTVNTRKFPTTAFLNSDGLSFLFTKPDFRNIVSVLNAQYRLVAKTVMNGTNVI